METILQSTPLTASFTQGRLSLRQDLEDNPSVTQGVTGLGQSKVDFALGHRKRATYAFAHLVPKKHCPCFFPALQVGQLVPRQMEPRNKEKI